MRKTNYDQSSSGLNLELNCFRDTTRAHYDFEESFARLGESLWVFTEFGNVSDNFSLSDAENYQFTVKEFKAAFVNSYDTELSRYYMNKPFSKLTKSELIELLEYQAYDKEEIAEFYRNNFPPLFDIITTRGYSQGDYAEVIITPEYKKYLADNGGTYDEKQQSKISELIDRLFWSTPISCCLSVNVNNNYCEYYLDEYLEDCYDWNKDKLMIDFTTKDIQFLALPGWQQKLIAEFLADNLPDYPEYE